MRVRRRKCNDRPRVSRNQDVLLSFSILTLSSSARFLPTSRAVFPISIYGLSRASVKILFFRLYPMYFSIENFPAFFTVSPKVARDQEEKIS